MSDKTENTIQMPEALRQAASQMKEHAVAPSGDVSNEVALDTTAKENTFVEGEGIYIGMLKPNSVSWAPTDDTYHVFVAPTDLEAGLDCRTWEDSVCEIGKLKNWHGHEGAFCPNEEHLLEMLKNTSAFGKWILPPRDLLCGLDANNNVTSDIHLLRLSRNPKFASSFSMKDKCVLTTIMPSFYWSCTVRPNTLSDVCCAWLRQSESYWRGLQVDVQASSRPIRLVRAAASLTL